MVGLCAHRRWHASPSISGVSAGWARSLVDNSALARYLFFNLQFYTGNMAAAPDAARIDASLAMIDAVFRDLPDIVGLPPDRILLTLDGSVIPNRCRTSDTY